MPLWDFVQARDLQAIGYPISQRWVNGPFTLQAFQKVILQWDPGKSRMNYYNTLDVLANRYPDVELPNVPPHQVLEADRGADFATITQNHLALLDQNAAIKQRFLSESDWLNLYGLPIRYEEREVNGNPQGLQMLRAQRTVFVIWNVPAPGVTVGRVNLQNVPDKVKRLSNVIIPDGAKAPVLASQVASLPVFSLETPSRPPGPTQPAVASVDRAALVALYHSTGGPNWITNSNWLSDAPLGEWHGVAADPSGRVTALRLEANGLRGQLPPDLGQLANLLELSLKGNELRGAIPPELGSLSKLLWLWLDGNQLSGAIPAALGNLTNLQLLHLNENQLSGAIPARDGRPRQPDAAESQRQPIARSHPGRPGPSHQAGTAGAPEEPAQRGDSARTGQSPRRGLAGAQRQPTQRANSVPTGPPRQRAPALPQRQPVDRADSGRADEPRQSVWAVSQRQPADGFDPAGVEPTRGPEPRCTSTAIISAAPSRPSWAPSTTFASCGSITTS